MKTLFQLIGLALLIVLIFLLHFAVLNLLPYPFNHINLVFLFMVWLIFYSGEARILWLAVPLSFLMELFSPSPFGVISLALVGSLSLLSWFLLNIFTNRSIPIVFLAGFLGMFIYRVLFYAFLFLFNVFNRLGFILPLETLLDAGYEILLTSVALTIFYVLSSFFIRRLNPRYVRMGNR